MKYLVTFSWQTLPVRRGMNPGEDGAVIAVALIAVAIENVVLNTDCVPDCELESAV